MARIRKSGQKRRAMRAPFAAEITKNSGGTTANSITKALVEQRPVAGRTRTATMCVSVVGQISGQKGRGRTRLRVEGERGGDGKKAVVVPTGTVPRDVRVVCR